MTDLAIPDLVVPTASRPRRNPESMAQTPNVQTPNALNELFASAYDDLRVLARSRLRRSNVMTSLDTTGLVHESYLRFVKAGSVSAADRSHFLAYAARVMRSIVVDLIRSRMSERHGGEAQRITLNTGVAESTAMTEEDVIRVDDALEELAKIDPRLVQVVEMRYFAGFSEKEIAAALGVTTRTVSRDWEKARCFLLAALK